MIFFVHSLYTKKTKKTMQAVLFSLLIESKIDGVNNKNIYNINYSLKLKSLSLYLHVLSKKGFQLNIFLSYVNTLKMFIAGDDVTPSLSYGYKHRRTFARLLRILRFINFSISCILFVCEFVVLL